MSKKISTNQRSSLIHKDKLNENQEVYNLKQTQVKSIEADFEKDMQIENKDIDKWARIRLQLREIGMQMTNEKKYSEFLNAVKELLKNTDLQNVNTLLTTFIDKPKWINSYVLIIEELLKKKPPIHFKSEETDLPALIKMITKYDIESADEARIKIELRRDYGIDAYLYLNISLEEYDLAYGKTYKGMFSRMDLMHWLHEAMRIGNVKIANEMESYILNNFSIYGDNPKHVKQNIQDTLDLLKKMKPSDGYLYMKNVNLAEKAYEEGPDDEFEDEPEDGLRVNPVKKPTIN